MTERKPTFVQKNPLDSSEVTGLEEAKDGEFLGLGHGGTGATTAPEARTNLGLTDPEIKSRYEGNADTNAFTDAEQSKLAGVDIGAEINTGSNKDVAGSDAQVFDAKVGNDLTFRTLTAGPNIQLMQDADHIDVGVSGGAGSGLDSDRLDGAEGSSYLDTDNHTDGSVNKVYSAVDKTKLAGVEDGANRNSGRAINPAGSGQPFREVDATTGDLLFRGVEAGDNVDVTQTSDLIKIEVTDAAIETAYNAQVPAVTQAEAEAGTLADIRRWTPERVKQAIMTLSGGGGAVDSVNAKTGAVVINPDDLDDTATTNKFTDAAGLAKLAGIESGATADLTASEVLALLLTVDGFGSGLDADKLQGISGLAYVDTDNHTDGAVNRVYSAVDKTKLAGIETAATADQTAAEIKSAYESNSNTNEFSDSEQTKLAGIEASATADQTAAEILTAVKTVDGSGSGLDADLLDGQDGTFYTSLISTNTDSITTNANDILTVSQRVDANDPLISANTAKVTYPSADASKLAAIEPLAEVNDKNTKSINVESPTGSEDISFFYAPSAITITELVAVIQGSTSVTWTLHYAPDRSLAGTKVITAGTATSSATTGDKISTFDSAGIPAGSFVWLETSAISGTPEAFFLSVEYTED